MVVVAVRDGGRVEKLAADMPCPDSPGGRGLGIVARLAQTWRYDVADGTRVTAELRLDGAA